MTTNTAAPPVTAPRPLLVEDVYRVVGALYLQVDLLTRENARLRELLEADGRPA